MMEVKDVVCSAVTRKNVRRLLPDLLSVHVENLRIGSEIPVETAVVAAHDGIAIVFLSTYEDLEVSIGLGQILTIDWINLQILAVLPTAGAVAHFQHCARQNGYDGQIQAIAGEELVRTLEDLNDDFLICVIPTLSVLTSDYVDNLKQILDNNTRSINNQATAGVYRAHELHHLSLHTISKQFVHAHDGVALSLPLSALCNPSRNNDAIESFRAAFYSFKATADAIRFRPRCVETAAFETQSISLIDGQVLLPDEFQSRGGTLSLRARPLGEFDAYRTIYQRNISLAGSPGKAKISLSLSLVTQNCYEAELAVHELDGGRHVLPLCLDVPPSRLQPWMVTCYLNRGGAGNSMIRAFANGIGCPLRYAEDEVNCRPGVPVVWGILRGSDRIVGWAKNARQYFFYVDHAYFSRGHSINYRITRNGYEAGKIRECPSDRFDAHSIDVLDWKKEGTNILVCPPSDFFMAAQDCWEWLENTLAMVKQYTDRPIKIRKKPKQGESVVPIAEDFQTAHALVTHSSNIAVEAAITGVPVFVSASSAAAPIGLTDLSKIEKPVYPDRRAWLSHLAYNQFSFAEIESGVAWKMLLELEERKFVSAY